MPDFVGADVEELRRLAGTLGDAAESMLEVRRIISHEVASLIPQHWAGDDANQFVGTWASDAEFLRLTADDLSRTSDRAAAEASEQLRTSQGY